MKSNRDLLQHILNQMERLDKGEIDVDRAKAQAVLAKQANNSFRYEVEKASLLFKLEQAKSEVSFVDLDK